MIIGGVAVSGLGDNRGMLLCQDYWVIIGGVAVSGLLGDNRGCCCVRKTG